MGSRNSGHEVCLVFQHMPVCTMCLALRQEISLLVPQDSRQWVLSSPDSLQHGDISTGSSHSPVSTGLIFPRSHTDTHSLTHKHAVSHKHIHTYTFTHPHTDILTYIHRQTCTHTHVHLYSFTHRYTHTYIY